MAAAGDAQQADTDDITLNPEQREWVADENINGEPYRIAPSAPLLGDDRLEILLAEVHLVSGLNELSVSARAARICSIAADIGAIGPHA